MTGEDKEKLLEVVADSTSEESGSGRGASMDDQITRAIRIGEDNAVIIQLYQNSVPIFRSNGSAEREWSK